MEGKTYLGIDIGGTSVKCGVVTEAGRILRRDSFDTGPDCTREGFLRGLYRVVDREATAGVQAVGVCTLGMVDAVTGEILGGVDNLPLLRALNLRHLLEERCGLPVHVANDGHAAARGEYWLGAARGSHSVFCLTLGTGIGGCLMVGGEVLGGAHHRAGEISLWDWRPDGRCLEREISTRAVMERAAAHLGLERIDGIGFFRRVRAGEAAAEELLSDWLEQIARALVNVAVLFDPECIVIGGGISKEGDILVPRLSALFEEMLPPECRGQTRIEAARCSNDAGLLGAVSRFIL